MRIKCFDWGFANLDSDPRFICLRPDSYFALEVEINSAQDLLDLSKDYDIMIRSVNKETILTFDKKGGAFRTR